MYNQLQRFLSWWKRGLLASIPQAWIPTYPQAHIRPADNGFLIERKDTGEQAELREDNSAANAVPAINLKDCMVILHIESEETLQHELQLPAAAENSLDALLGHEIERRTPFTTEQIYYGYSVRAYDAAQNNITVHIAAIPRARLDPALKELARYGIRPHQVRVNNYENLLPKSLRPAPPGSARNTIAPPLALCLILALACIYAPLWQQHNLRQQLDIMVQQNLQVALKLQQLQEQQEQVAARGNFLSGWRDANLPAIELLQHISMLLPDNTALQNFRLDKGYITITGESDNASGLIALLAASPMLHQPAFRSPVIHSDRNQRERFSITASLQIQQQNKDDDG